MEYLFYRVGKLHGSEVNSLQKHFQCFVAEATKKGQSRCFYRIQRDIPLGAEDASRIRDRFGLEPAYQLASSQ